MESVEIIANGKYLPQKKITNQELNQRFQLEENWIEKRCGILTRHYVEKESIVDLAKQATEDVLKKVDIDKQKIGVIVVATTSTDRLMPGISFEIQKQLDINHCMCMDLLCGCSGYINALDVARKYMLADDMEYGLVIGTEVLSKFMKEDDIDTRILLGDGAGATLLHRTKKQKQYAYHMESIGQQGDILTCSEKEPLYMNGREIYKFGITKTITNIETLLEKAKMSMEDIKYVVPHQSNVRMLKHIGNKLNIPEEKLYIHIKQTGNTFCASIPIALNQMFEEELLQPGDKIILIGYGGGLNLGSILLEI